MEALISITHLLFVYDVFLFGDGSLRDAKDIQRALKLYVRLQAWRSIS
jgi:hypothetical protein